MPWPSVVDQLIKVVNGNSIFLGPESENEDFFRSMCEVMCGFRLMQANGGTMSLFKLDHEVLKAENPTYRIKKSRK